MSPDAFLTSQVFRGKLAESLLSGLDRERVPTHVAVIMDGNGRWASKRGLPRLAGHSAGAKSVRKLIAASIELGISYLTIYSFSSENWNRPIDEVSGLMALFVEVLERELESLMRMQVRVRVIGDTRDLPRTTAEAFEKCVARTAENTGLTLVVALNYGGRAEIVNAARALAVQACSGAIAPDGIDEKMFADALTTSGIPDPDLVIRTSGEKRISNFLLWEIAYSELWITMVLWPDFKPTDLLKAVLDFQKRDRRFGGRS
ncbi:MAG: isoprenyl transferase [Coriobacteriia bacterium]|nr:isoprenyl transferase [Coriobacteriia bacterium]